MKSIRVYAPLLSTLLVLAACQTPLQPTTRAPQVAQSVSLAASESALRPAALEGKVQVQGNAQFSRVSFVPKQSGGFATQALRRSEIASYRMTVSWPGNETGLSETVDANSFGVLPGPITVENVPSGNLRVIVLDALDENGDAILDLRSGHVYNQTGSADYNAEGEITRPGRAVAETIRYFSHSELSGDETIFEVWEDYPTDTLDSLKLLVNAILDGKDSLALNSDTLIVEIQDKGDGSLPAAGDVQTASFSDFTLTYEIPSGYILPAGARLSLDTASSPTAVIPAPQSAGIHTVRIPNVYLPQGTNTDSRVLRLFAEDDSGYQTPLYSNALALDNDGIQSGTPGSGGNPLSLPTAMLTALEPTSTFYVDDNRIDNSGDGTSEATAWQTIAYALSQIKAQTANGDFGATVPVLIVDAGTYAENNLIVDFPLQIIGEGTDTLISSAGVAFELLTDTNDPDYATSASKRISVASLTLSGFGIAAFNLANNHITLSGISSTGPGTGTGLTVNAGTSVDDLIVTDSAFNNHWIGLGVAANDDDASTFSNVSVSNTRFNENLYKGVYLEKANDVVFDGILIDYSGSDPLTANNTGFELTLKGSTNSAAPKLHSNIQLINSTIASSGYQGTSTFPAAYGRAAVSIKAREVGTNFVTVNDITISGNTISGPMQTLRFGAPDQNLGSGSMFSNIVLSDNQLSHETNLGYTGAERYLIINHTRADIDASDNTFNGEAPTNATWPFIWDGNATNPTDQPTTAFTLGEVSLGFPRP